MWSSYSIQETLRLNKTKRNGLICFDFQEKNENDEEQETNEQKNDIENEIIIEIWRNRF